ncbi:hypothetical protein K6U06_22655 [Acidiferrimicrobium sp. IK]|uniref:hypothetical protein n=1 Tax=Acidiferrimicrobium sp. IK TaxID=2871700 RepID=UPI0021CB6D64|nr:hypothetical protein [Acidiferrimicrobium sp. IK]MCU4187181.1 hypothetical protein [Acidiferrimicrobium sp. IK]
MSGAPVGGLTARQWRRLQRRARAAHERQVLWAARRLTGSADMTAEASVGGVVCVRNARWQVALAGTVVAGTVVAGTVVPGSGRAAPCRLDGVGRYGRWWWLRLITGGRSVTVLGSHLRVDRLGDGGDEGTLDSPAGGELILAACDCGCPSATSPG